MRALDDHVRAGKVLYIGISDAPAWIVARANAIAVQHGWTQFSAVQAQYSLVERTAERDLAPTAQALDLALTAWSPLGMGVLTEAVRPNGGARRTILEAREGPRRPQAVGLARRHAHSVRVRERGNASRAAPGVQRRPLRDGRRRHGHRQPHQQP